MFADRDVTGGFHETEADDFGPFVWTEGSFNTRLKHDGQGRGTPTRPRST